jgi:hypothetical protein
MGSTHYIGHIPLDLYEAAGEDEGYGFVIQ